MQCIIKNKINYLLSWLEFKQISKIKNVFFVSFSVQTVVSQQEFAQLYTVGTMLGKGGFGTVYAGFRNSDQLPVAIKSVSKNRPLILLPPDSKSERERFVPVEVVLMQQVTHVSGVIRLIDYFELPDCFMIIMERMSATSTGSGSCKDLFDFISDSGPIKEDLAKHIFQQMVTTVNQVHAAGVVHRDIKDENILIDTRTYKVKLIDFGSGSKLHNEVYTDFDGESSFQILITLSLLKLKTLVNVITVNIFKLTRFTKSQITHFK